MNLDLNRDKGDGVAIQDHVYVVLNVIDDGVFIQQIKDENAGAIMVQLSKRCEKDANQHDVVSVRIILN